MKKTIDYTKYFKFILFLISLCLLNLKIYGSDSGNDKKYNITAGINNTNTFNDSVTANSIVMPWLSFIMENEINDKLSFIAGIDLNIKGRRFDQPAFLSERYNYLSFPLGIKYTPKELLSFYAGLYPGILFAANRIFLEGQSALGTKRERITHISDFDASVMAGTKFPLSQNVSFNFRYHHSINSYTTHDPVHDFRHHGFQFGFTFNITSSDLTASKVNPQDSIAAFHIKELKRSAILVRLQNNLQLIEKLEKEGFHDRANEYKKQIADENLKIVNAFENHFNFCPAYYFFANHSRNIRNEYFQDSIFLDSKLNYVLNVEFHYDNFYIVDFGRFLSDVSGFEMNGFVIKNRNFITLKRPFPYYVTVLEATGLRVFDNIFLIDKRTSSRSGLRSSYLSQEDYNSMVRLLNNKLFTFYNSIFNIEY